MNDLVVLSQTIFLASIRLAIGFAMTPLLSAFGVPAMSRLILVFILACIVAGDGVLGSHVLSDTQMLLRLCEEIFLGVYISAGVHAGFAALAIAGRLLDVQLGFSMGAILDPISRGHANVIATTMSLLGVLMFFSCDLHLDMLPAIMQSFDVHLSWQSFQDSGLDLALALGAQMFLLGLRVAAPVVLSLLLADAVVALVSRNLPQMNLLLLSIPMKLLLGLGVLTVSASWISPVVEAAMRLPLAAMVKLMP